MKKIEMQVELYQPWSTFVMSTQLPPVVLEKMIRITDEIVENRAGKGDDPGAGQLKDQFYIKLEILEQEEVMGFFLNIIKNYIIQAFFQSQPFKKEEIVNESCSTQMTSMWINSQKDNEYFPIHIHENCALSAVMYLKIPEFLPARKSYGRDGAIIFTNNSSTDKIWGNTTLEIHPQVGDFFIFPAEQRHFVYPFRTADGKGERRSVSLNAEFTPKTLQSGGLI